MFAAINLLSSSCTVHAAAKMDNHQVKSAKGTYYLNTNANSFPWTSDSFTGVNCQFEPRHLLYVLLGVAAAETQTEALRSWMNDMFE